MRANICARVCVSRLVVCKFVCVKMGSRFLVLQAGDRELAKSQCIAMKGDINRCFKHALIDANFLRIPKC